jgi:hypothetical protein
MSQTRALLIVASILILPAVTAAQPKEGEWELTLTGTGNNNNDFDAGGFGASGSLGYFLTEDFELLLRQSFIFANSDEESGSYAASTRVAADYHFDIGRFRPFIGANLGIAYGNDVEETGFAAPELGAKFYVKEQTFLFALAEYQFFFDNASDADEAFDDGQFVYSIGIGFSW